MTLEKKRKLIGRCRTCGVLKNSEILSLLEGFCSPGCKEREKKAIVVIQKINQKRSNKKKYLHFKEKKRPRNSAKFTRLKDQFYLSREWRELRYKVLKTYGRKCMLCSSTDAKLHVDHIKPRSSFPQLALSFENLQVLCDDCNIGKSNRDQTDWRPENVFKRS